MKFDILQVVGVAFLVVGGQAAVRLLVDHSDTGLLGRLPGGFPILLTAYVVAVVVGVALTAWAHRKARSLGRRG